MVWDCPVADICFRCSPDTNLCQMSIRVECIIPDPSRVYVYRGNPIDAIVSIERIVARFTCLRHACIVRKRIDAAAGADGCRGVESAGFDLNRLKHGAGPDDMTSFHDEATPIWGLTMSSSLRPMARNMARAGARFFPSVTSELRGFGKVLIAKV